MRAVLGAILAGAVAGLGCFVLESVLALTLLGYGIPREPAYVGWYSLVGALAGVAVAVHNGVAGRVAWLSLLPVGATAFALLQVPSVFERVYRSLLHEGHRSALATAAGLAAIALYAAFLGLLAYRGRPRTAASLLLGSGLLSVGLAVHRHLLHASLGTGALLAAAATLLTPLVLVEVVARLRGRRGGLLAAGALTGAAALWLGYGVLGTQGHGFGAGSEGAPRRHLLLIVIDTLRADVFESVVSETDEGRRLAAAFGPGAWFGDAVAASPWTAPSMGTIMTGLDPSEHGLVLEPESSVRIGLTKLAPSASPLAAELARRGYATEAIVTNELLHPRSGIARGFHRYSLLSGATWYHPLLYLGERLEWVPAEPYQPAADVRRRFERRLPRLLAQQRPFMLWLHLMDPHSPLVAHPSLPAEPGGRSRPRLDGLYRDEVRYTLREVARIVEELRSSPAWPSTVVILTSDHGEMLPSDRRKAPWPGAKSYGHGHALYEELILTPLVVRVPEGTHGELPPERGLRHVDLFPRLARWLSLQDLAAEPRTTGAAASEATVNRQPDVALVGSMQEGPLQMAVRTPEFKLIEFPGRPEWSELYDLRTDPQERTNLADRKPRKLATARSLLAHERAKLGKALPTQRQVLDAAARRRLEALGYVE
jgi:arylsulfatase A-like enzyme